jgi:hypothetical protein
MEEKAAGLPTAGKEAAKWGFFSSNLAPFFAQQSAFRAARAPFS